MRVAELSRALADAGHQTHVLFVGDPFLWDGVVDNLLGRVEFLAMRQGMSMTEPPSAPHVRGSRAVPATPPANGLLARAS